MHIKSRNVKWYALYVSFIQILVETSFQFDISCMIGLESAMISRMTSVWPLTFNCILLPPPNFDAWPTGNNICINKRVTYLGDPLVLGFQLCLCLKKLFVSVVEIIFKVGIFLLQIAEIFFNLGEKKKVSKLQVRKQRKMKYVIRTCAC